jgi:FlaA1/EpsC-like NDP-sugar epimerase
MNALRQYDRYSRLNQRLLDALLVGLAFYLAYLIRFEGRIPPDSAFQMWLLLGPVMAGQILMSWLTGTYRLVWRYIGLTDALVVARGYALWSACLLIIFLAVPDRLVLLRIPRSVIVVHFLLSLELGLTARGLRRLLHERVHRRSPGTEVSYVTRILLVGAGHAGTLVARELARRPELKAVGFLDDDPAKRGTVIGGLRVLGPLSALPSVVREEGVEEVVISIARASRDTLKRIWALTEPLPVRTKIVPTVEEILQGRKNVAAFRDVDLTDLLHREPVRLRRDQPELGAAYGGRRILVTGAGGSIGSELACQLLELGPAELILLDKDENGLHEACLRLPAALEAVPVHPVVRDIRSRERLEAVFGRFRPEVVFHAAAHKHVNLMEVNPCEAILNNVGGTRNVLECSLAAGVSRFVVISTDKAVRPTCVMGATKRLCEMLVESVAVPGARYGAVRFGNVIGSRGSVVPIFRQQILEGRPVTLTHLEAERYLMTIPEAVTLLLEAGTLADGGRIFVLDMGPPVRIRDLAVELIEHSGLRPGHDIPIKVTELGGGEKLREELVDPAAETLQPTTHPKIAVIEAARFDREEFGRQIQALEQAARREAAENVVRILQGFNFGFRPAVGEPRLRAAKAASDSASLKETLWGLLPLPGQSS